MSNRSTGGKTRRSVLKSGAVISAFAGVGGAASVGRAERGSDRATPRPSKNHAAAVPPKIRIGDNLKKLDWVTLIGSERESMARALLRHIDNAEVHQQTRQRARETLKGLWADVQIQSEHTQGWEIRDGNPSTPAGNKSRGRTNRSRPSFTGSVDRTTTVYTLDSDIDKITEVAKEKEQRLRQESQEVTTTASDFKTVPTLAKVINSGVKAETQGDDIGTMWNMDSGHDVISYWAGHNMDIYPELYLTLEDESPNPDNWDYDFPDLSLISWNAGQIQQNMDGFPETVTHAYAHAYNPDTKMGHADHWVGDKMKDALEYDPESNDRYLQVGYAMHFLEDLGNPLHTGEFQTQATHQNIHTNYELTVSNYINKLYEPNCIPERWWKTCESTPMDHIMDSIRDLPTFEPVEEPGFFDGNKWENHATNLASFSSQYSADVITATMEDSEAPLQNNPWLLEDTCAVLEKTTKYAMGLIAEIHPRFS
ncbi:MAG: hypothetical protein V5A34_07310 [Halapricum sp.]